MPIENFNEVREFLEANKDSEDVKGLFTGYIPKDSLETYLEGEEGKKLLQPRLDKNFSKGLETWKANNLSKLIDEEVTKKLPNETPEQKLIREMQEKLIKMEQQTHNEKLKNTVAKKMSEVGLPVELIDYLNASDEEGYGVAVEKINTLVKALVESQVAEKIKSPTPKGSSSEPSKQPTKEELANMSMKDRLDFYNKNKELFQKIMNS